MHKLTLIIVAIIVVLVILWLVHSKEKNVGHYIGHIYFDPSVGLPPEAVSMTLDENGNLFANSRLEYPEILPPVITAGDLESSWLGRFDCGSGLFHMMAYRQGAIPALFNLPVSTSPNYVMVMTGHLKVRDGVMESTDVKLAVGPTDYEPPAALTQAAAVTKISLKRHNPSEFFKAF